MHLVFAVAFSMAFSSPGGAEEPDVAENAKEVLAKQQRAEALKSRFSFDAWMLGCLSREKFAELEAMADTLRQDDVDLDWDDAGLRHC